MIYTENQRRKERTNNQWSFGGFFFEWFLNDCRRLEEIYKGYFRFSMDDGYDFFFKQLPFFQYPYVGKEKSIPFPTTAMAPAAKRPMPEVTFTGVANRFAR